MTGALYLFLGALISLNKAAGRVGRKPLEKALRYIGDNFSRPISVQQIADFAGVSRSQLYRLFVGHLHVTPMEYLLEIRIATACALFNRHRVSVSEAAYSVGFSDPLYFSRMFKKLRGVSPSAFRQQSGGVE
jgi:AraC-like DNA-binding protein